MLISLEKGVKAIVRRLFAEFGFELRRLTPGETRGTDQSSLQVVHHNGLDINTVIDVGAAFGNWTRVCIEVFPQAQYVLVEPLPQYDTYLSSLCHQYQNVTRIKAAVSDHSGQATFFFHADWVGSSLLQETEGPQIDDRAIHVQTVRLDDLVEQQKLTGPFLLKIDVQGAELQVLSGATNILRQAEYILVETSLFKFFKDGPLLQEVIGYLQQHNFVVYDILNPQYRPLDNALGQVDLVFVPAHSILRKEHIYASPQQRLEQNRQFIKNRTKQGGN